MKTNIVIKKVWEDSLCAKINIKFQSEFNDEDFMVSGNLYVPNGEMFENLSKALINGSGKVLFESVDNDYCELIIDKNLRGLINIRYRLCVKETTYDVENNVKVDVNTGYILEPATIDRNAGLLKDFYNSPEGSEIGLIC